MKHAFIIIPLFAALIALDVWCGMQLSDLKARKLAVRNDYNDINSLDNGILSADKWKEKIMVVLNERINDFSFTRDQEKVIESEISATLYILIDKADSIVQNEHHSFSHKIRKMAVKAFVNIDDLRKRVPEFSHSIMLEVKKQKNMNKIKDLARQKIAEYAAMTSSETDFKAYEDSIFAIYKVSSKREFNEKAVAEIGNDTDTSYRLSFLVISTVLVALLMWWIYFKKRPVHKLLFYCSIATALVILFLGLTSPMIEIDARINKLNFTFMGDDIKFGDQVLYYQSKSILDVVVILIKTYKIDATLVGIMILAFSIIFPISKLISTAIHVSNPARFSHNGFINFMAFKSGKWSMADVMVVAIFMSYVGFRSILNSQMGNLNSSAPNYSIISTNLTALQPGFLIFVSFVIFNFVLSEILKRIYEAK